MDETNEMLDKLILSGAVEVAGVDSSTGEFLYQFTNKLKEISPQMYNEHINHVNKEIMKLWEMGFLNVNMTEDNPIVTITAKALDESEVSKLEKEDRWGLEEIKRLLKSQEL